MQFIHTPILFAKRARFSARAATANIQLPIIFITGYGDIPMTVQAMKEGAIEFLAKPFREQELLDAIQLGLEKDRRT